MFDQELMSKHISIPLIYLFAFGPSSESFMSNNYLVIVLFVVVVVSVSIYFSSLKQILLPED